MKLISIMWEKSEQNNLLFYYLREISCLPSCLSLDKCDVSEADTSPLLIPWMGTLTQLACLLTFDHEHFYSSPKECFGKSSVSNLYLKSRASTHAAIPSNMAAQPSSPTLTPSSSPERSSSPLNPPRHLSESTSIHSVPVELLLIASHLTYPALPILRFTHPFFYYALPATPPTYAEILAAKVDSLASTLGLLGCTNCLRMLPTRFFRELQRARPCGCCPDGRQCYRCESECIEHWRLWHTVLPLHALPREARLLVAAEKSVRRVCCKLCWAPLVGSEALERKRWGYCEACAMVGSGRTVSGTMEAVSVKEWGRRWGMNQNKTA